MGSCLTFSDTDVSSTTCAVLGSWRVVVTECTFLS